MSKPGNQDLKSHRLGDFEIVRQLWARLHQERVRESANSCGRGCTKSA